MGTIFISHSSRNNDRAIAIQQWLAANGWDDVFLDLDPQRGIVAGQRWKEALQQAAHRCEVVLALVSREWLASGWCKAEVDAARLMGKKIIIALIGVDKSEVPLDLTDEQWIDLDGDPDARMRLKEGLTRVGLDPSSFPFEAGRRPYPGFAFLEEKDAAIFFGRDAQIVRGLDKIRGLVRTGVDRMLVILGASGSGKSSFLRAGLWPRLKRDDRTWLPLPIVRPERAVLSGQFGLAQALQSVMSDPAFADQIRKRDLPRSRATIQEFIETTEDGLAKIFAALRSIAHVPAFSSETAPPPTIVLAVDQGEELFNEEGRDEARRFIAMLTHTLKGDPGVLALVAMRSDAFPQLQTDPNLAQLSKDTFTLDMMLEGSYRAVIEGPARLVQPNRLKIDPQLTDALLEDLTGQDALPLLAFTLAHLYERYAVDNELTLAGYEKLGRLKGVIDSTVREGFAEGVARGELPKDGKAQFALARAAFIPHLARVNAAGQFVRRVATRAEIPTEAWPLIDRFAERRLLIKDRRKIAGQDLEVVEVAHEALLREWRELHEALLEEREFLVAKAQLEQDVSEWRAASESRKSGALLSGNKLLRTRDWLITRPQDLSVEERQFIKASSDQELRQRRWRRVAVVGAFISIVGFSGYASMLSWRADSELKKAQTTQSRFLADLARQQRTAGDAGTAALLALEALPDHTAGTNRPYVAEPELQLDGAWRDLRERLVLGGHESAVSRAAFSPDGKRIVTASEDKTARLWDAETGKPIGEPLKGHLNIVSSAAFSPDGKRVVTASHDETARLWDAETGKPIGEPLKGHEFPLGSAAFSPDGKRIATASYDKAARLWDAETGKPIGELLKGHENVLSRGATVADVVSYGPTVAAFSPDGRRIVTAYDNKMARLWDSETGKPIGEPLEGHMGSVWSAAFSPDGKRIVTVSNTEQRARLWDAATGKPIGEPLKGHLSLVWSAVFSPDGRRIVTASTDGTARLWDGETGKPIGDPLKGHTRSVRSAAFSPDGKRILTASDDHTARLWDAETGKPIGELKGHLGRVLSAAFSPDGRRIVTTSDDKTARLWNADTDKPISEPLKGHEKVVSYAGTVAAFSPDGKRIVTASDDKTARLWDGESGKPIGEPLKGHEDFVRRAAFSPDGKRIVTASNDKTARLWDGETGKPIGGPLKGHEFPLSSAAFSPDGKRIVTASDDKTARLWDADTGKPIGEPLTGHDGGLFSAAFSPDGKRIVTASGDTTRLWDAETGKPIGGLNSHEGGVHSAAFSPDGKRIVIVGTKTAWLCDGETGKLIGELEGHEGSVYSAAFSPDGRRIVTSDDTLARLWSAATGKPIGEPLKGHEKVVLSAAFSPDGKRIVTASMDEMARLWDAEAGKPIGEPLKGHADAVMSAEFSPDGKRILTTSTDGMVRLWKIFANTQELVSHAKAGIPRCLTAAQRDAFFLPPEPPQWCIDLKKWPYHGGFSVEDVQ